MSVRRSSTTIRHGGPRAAALMDAPLGSPTRPSWRGRLHLLALFVALPMFVVLATVVDGARARAGVIVYAVGLCSMLATSTTYHRWVHTVRSRRIWQRVDHAVIFAAIAGTFTAVCLLVLDTRWAVVMLVGVWVLALVGATMKITGRHIAGWFGSMMYIAIGWAGVLLIPTVWQRGGVVPMAMLSAGGIIYTLGAIGFGRRWPTLRPATFSYHEVWHAMTLAAASAHVGAVWMMAT